MLEPISQRLAVIASALSPDPRQAPRLARQLGSRGLLFDAFGSSLSIPELSVTGRREFRHMLSSQDQRLVGLQLDMGARGLGPGADVDQQIDRVDRAMEASAGMGSPLVCVDLGPLPAAPAIARPRPAVSSMQAGLIIVPASAPAEPEPPAAAPPDPAFVSQVNAAMAEIGVRADRYSVIVAFSTALAGFASLNQAMLAARCPWFGVDLDPVSILRDEWSRDDIFSALGPLVRHVRARDGAVGAQKRVKPAVLGKGDARWEELLGLLDEAGYQGFITLDPMELADRAGAVRAGVEHLRSIGA